MKKIIHLNDLISLRKINKNLTIGLAHGVFDLFHYGHLLHLKKAKEQCDILVVSVTSDKFVNKAPNRPYYNLKKRIEFLSSINLVDYVVASDYESAKEIIDNLKPNFYFKGSEYANYKKDFTGKISKEINLIKKYNGKVVFTNEPVLSSSYLINNFFSTLKEDLKEFIIKNKKKLNFEKVIKNYEFIKKQKVLVIGDSIIDEYIFSEALSKSPKEQIISVKQIDKEVYNGGILATVNHVSNFCENVTLVTLMGQGYSENKKYIKKINSNVRKKIFYEKNFKTIIKTRYLDNDNKKIFQKTNQDYFLMDKTIENKIMKYLKKNLKLFDQVIINDFGHGLLSDKIVNILQKKSKNLCINAQTNSANHGYNYISKYSKSFYISVDEPEARLATKKKFEKTSTLFNSLKKQINYKICSITFGKNGTRISDSNQSYFIPSISDRVIDTMGAGDAYFALTSIFSKFLKKDLLLLGLIGNVAGAIKIQYLGHRDFVNSKKFLGYLKTLLNI
jgi:cytidyltransferase-like protein